MKYIDAKSQKSLKSSVMGLMDISTRDLNDIFESIYNDTVFIPEEWVKVYLSDFISDEILESVQMYHLSRRLRGTYIKSNNNLHQLLLKESPLSDFFKRFQVTFYQNDNHIDLYYKGKLQPLEDEFRYSRGNIYYLRSRLGYNNEKDYCVNGFAFRSYLEQNQYFNALSRCPELVYNIEQLLDIKGMCDEYYNNSDYYCIEYLIPFSEVIFDMNNPPETNYEKTVELLSQAILRLYNEWIGINFMCDENLILRLSDDAAIKKDWFIDYEKLLQS